MRPPLPIRRPRRQEGAGPAAPAKKVAGPAEDASRRPAGSRTLGRIPVADVFPSVDGGTRPSKSVVGEEFDITATVYREGHDAVNANVVLTDPAGADHDAADDLHQPGPGPLDA